MAIYNKYLKNIINSEWVTEIISEKFDNATENLEEFSVIYGGAVRDAIAGFELVGDLDIVTSRFTSLIYNKFKTDPKWVYITDNVNNDEYGINNFDGNFINKPTNNPILNIKSFKGIKNQIVQIMKSSSIDNNNLLNVLHVVYNVDIVCCGLILLNDGSLLEVIPGAYDDCINKILRLNIHSEKINYKKTKKRIEKLVNRGWINLINDNELKLSKTFNKGEKNVVNTTVSESNFFKLFLN